MGLVQSLITSDKYGIKCPYSMKAKGITIHNTANDAPAKNEVSYMKTNNNEVSFHIAIDDTEAIQAIPFNRNAWHAGDGGNGDGNRNYIAVEICYSKSGGTKFTNAENRAVKEVAMLCKQLGFTVNNIKAHRDFSGKNCPHRTDITSFKNRVQAELNAMNKPNRATYRVIVDNKQIGAYSVVENVTKEITARINSGAKIIEIQRI